MTENETKQYLFAYQQRDIPWWKQLIWFTIILGILFGIIWLWIDYQGLKDFKFAIEYCEIDCGGAWQDYLETVGKAAEEARKEGWPFTEEEKIIWAYRVCMEKCVEKEMEL